jgi:tRNA dimethylallyltransferase
LGRHAIGNIVERGILPLLVGGSGLYFRAVVDDLRFPPRSSEVRAVLEDEVEQQGPEALHRRLSALDPRAAERIEPQNARRTVRALEAITLTGRRFSENDAWDRYESIYDLCVAGLERPRDDLYARIEARVDGMLDRGLLHEVEVVSRRGLGPTAMQALGYRQVLESGAQATDADKREAIVGATKRFARRQQAWFKADPRVRWFDASAPDLPVQLMGYFRAGLGLA